MTATPGRTSIPDLLTEPASVQSRDDCGLDADLLRSLWDGLPDALLVLRLPDGTVTAANLAAEEMFQLTAEEILGHGLEHFFAEAAGPCQFAQSCSRAVSHGDTSPSQFSMLRADGTIFETELRIFRAEAGVGEEVEPAPGATPRCLIWIRDTSAILRDRAALEAGQRQLRRLSRRFLDGQEEERRRIARELHDELGQQVCAAQLSLAALARLSLGPSAEPFLETCNRRLERLGDQVRSLALDLRPPMLDDLGLLPTLRWFLDRRLGLAGYRHHGELPEQLPPLTQEIEGVCFRLVQEAVTNIVRHADAKEVAVALTVRDGGLELEVRDDGRGFDLDRARPSAEHEALGLLSMRERVALVGGSLEILTQPGSGTSIRARIPLPATPRPDTPRPAGTPPAIGETTTTRGKGA